VRGIRGQSIKLGFPPVWPNVTVLPVRQVIAEAGVWRGESQPKVGLGPRKNDVVSLLWPALSSDSVEAEIVHQGADFNALSQRPVSGRDDPDHAKG